MKDKLVKFNPHPYTHFYLSNIVKISPVGIEDTLVIDIEPICDCECATEGSEGFDFTSEFCDFHGEWLFINDVT